MPKTERRSFPPLGGAGLITLERERQISREGYTPEHDDWHTGGELAAAAVCYAMTASMRASNTDYPPGNPSSGRRPLGLALWPLLWRFKPRLRTDLKSDTGEAEQLPLRIVDLVRAGALIAAEIDRLQRREEYYADPC
jgi:hypothetical protein